MHSPASACLTERQGCSTFKVFLPQPKPFVAEVLINSKMPKRQKLKGGNRQARVQMKWNNQHLAGEELAGFCSGRWRAQPQEPLHTEPVFPLPTHTTAHRGWNLSPVRARIFAPLPQEVSGDAVPIAHTLLGVG